MTETTDGTNEPVDVPDRDEVLDATTDGEPVVPDWEDEYVDRVSDRLLVNYDLEKDVRIGGEWFELYGRLVMENHKQFFHPALNYANHDAEEHLFVTRVDAVGVPDLQTLADLGHALADEWITPSERHFGTEFTFALVAPSIPGDVHEFVDGFRDRTLLKFGYHGKYEVNLVVVAPAEQAVVASQNADVQRAFALWQPPQQERDGLLRRVARRLRP
ncbi:hypothetical protein [Halomicrococcus gelatinilyticus]|uniref:hypothetical protein n=1 Tax=Halomicrococcus gelatinilyticus TaxID=1702103 RepID=UPI002E0E9701